MELVILISAFILGAFHALEPGHGKSVMAAFVLGTDANITNTLTLGFTVVFSHTFVIFLMGILSLYLSNYLNVGNLSSTMEIIGGIILLLVGFWILKSYFKPHIHAIDTNKSAVAIGLSAGLIPCPAALAVLLISISSGAIMEGLAYVVVFSLGLAISISLFSILFVKSKDFLEKYVSNNSINKLPLLSGIIIILFGIWNISGPLFNIH
ncbi:sulfite exporter TauE/SafE family protein [Methanococcus voltae]|uniref:High-affinity nickel-transporter n=1 Tax=Methanococcus voltae (strain ATCC BAA-1334 / A3) TaxID=456320 RepID=D7DRS6_METV3|nr:sulfite exporter TauE/SafE family protein [Methanococcus voltae]MCS3901154.1 ABC-type nickel/cobalt efflux system permease component RcnA [Methanococcus voltae]